MHKKNTPVLILCGGRPILSDSHINSKSGNKGLIFIGDKPLFTHVMDQYVNSHFKSFVLAIGIGSDLFIQYLLDNNWNLKDPSSSNVILEKTGIKVRIVNTGENSTTSERLLKCEDILKKHDFFAMTYSDTLCDMDIKLAHNFFINSNSDITLTGVRLPVKFRVLGIRNQEKIIRGFSSRPVIDSGFINGGYYFLSKNIWKNKKLLIESTAFENEFLEKYADEENLEAYLYDGLWQNMESDRDIEMLKKISDYNLLNKFSDKN